MNKKITAIIQARLGSKRFPNKVISELNGFPLIIFLIKRLKKCKKIDEIILATTNNPEDKLLSDICKNTNIKIYRGDENDVLKRFCYASRLSKSEIIIRITGDCPFIDPYLITEIIEEFKKKDYDYLSNCYPPTFPDGLDVEIFKKYCLEEANSLSQKPEEREHVTPWIRNNKDYVKGSLTSDKDFSHLRLTVDEPEDLELLNRIILLLNDNFTWKDIIKIEETNKQIFNINSKFKRNEGALMDSGQKLWRRAKKIIPGGNMLLSKRSEMFLPDKWPSYFEKANGCNVWTLENKKLIDMTTMGVGTNLLGYSNHEVDMKVQEAINKGIMTSLNCPEEVYLAEKLIELHPWASKVRFARTGGEANAIAIRIARAASGKDKVAICGYHGWHDWYLATNLDDEKSLNKHLLPGLKPRGVPRNLKGTTIPFTYNNLKEFKELISNHDIGAVKMEVQRSVPPKSGFLEEIRRICDEKQIILIFDECTSGFRETFGGLHKKYNVFPDIAILGKALGNGYAITSVIGKENIMDVAQATFISSTFWTERIGPVAALETLKIMEKEKSWEYVTSLGKYLKKKWNNLANINNLSVEISGLSALPAISFKNKNNLLYKTLITQEMLKKGYLASTLCYLSTAHNEQIIDNYIEELNEVFCLISKCEKEGTINKYLTSDVCHSGFERLN